jgi:hypothetical protein
MADQKFITRVNHGGVMYCSADELMAVSKIFFKNCQRSRQIITKHALPADHFVYMRRIEGKGCGWKKTNGASFKYDKLFIREDWIDKHVPEFNGEQYEIGPAPDIIQLDASEKFKDMDEDIIEVEVRGKRDYNKCYFDVNAISNAFNLPSLHKNLVDKARIGCREGIHYKYFNCILTDKKVKKRLFLTFAGFIYILGTSKLRKNPALTAKIFQWIDQFNCVKYHDFTINVPEYIRLSKNGIVYCVSSPLLEAAKIGYWTGSIPGFMSRYITPYGKNLQLFYVFSDDAKQLETKIHEKFADQRITNELFKKSHWNEYEAFLKHHMTGETDVTKSDTLQDLPRKTGEHDKISERRHNRIPESYSEDVADMIDQIQQMKVDTAIKDLECTNKIAEEVAEKKLLRKDYELLQKDNLLLEKDNLLLQKDIELLKKNLAAMEKKNKLLKLRK